MPTREGDKTVVYPSALATQGETYYFHIFDYNEQLLANIQHRDLLSASSVQSLVKNVIEEKIVIDIDFVSMTKPDLADIDDQLLVRTNSPVILGVYDEFGNFTGIDQSQDLNAPVFLIVENIPGSYFLISGDSQSIFLPVGGTYTFVYRGTSDGDTTVEIGSFSNDQELISQTFTDIITTASTTATFLVSSESDEIIIELDENGDGTADGTIFSDEKMLELQAEEDQETPPVEKTLPPAPSGGGGPLWNSPAPSAPPPLVLGTSTEATAEPLPIAQPQANNAPPSELIAVLPSISEPVSEVLTQEYDNMPEAPEPVEQTAAAVQSGWYDVFISFVKETLYSMFSFFKTFF